MGHVPTAERGGDGIGHRLKVHGLQGRLPRVATRIAARQTQAVTCGLTTCSKTGQARGRGGDRGETATLAAAGVRPYTATPDSLAPGWRTGQVAKPVILYKVPPIATIAGW